MVLDGVLVLGVTHGPEPRDPAEHAALLDALLRLQQEGADVRLLAADTASGYLLGLLGAPQPEIPAELAGAVLPVVAAHPSYPVVAAWPQVAATRPGCGGWSSAEAERRAVSLWVTRVVEAAYVLHTATPVGLVVADASEASRAVALMLAQDFGVAVLALVPDPVDRTRADAVLVESAATVWCRSEPGTWDVAGLPSVAVGA